MTEIVLTLDGRDLRRLNRLASVSRVMAAKSLTFTAEKAVPYWRAGHKVFHKRRTWIDKGVRMRPASSGNLNAQVGSVDRYMGRHVVGIGEEKRGKLFVPTYPGGAISRVGTHTQVRRTLRSAARSKRKPFVIETFGGALVVRRKGKSRLPLIVMGKLQTGADVPERLDALEIVAGTVRREFGPIYGRLLVRWAETGAV
jgi:hypothetical protein